MTSNEISDSSDNSSGQERQSQGAEGAMMETGARKKDMMFKDPNMPNPLSVFSPEDWERKQEAINKMDQKELEQVFKNQGNKFDSAYLKQAKPAMNKNTPSNGSSVLLEVRMTSNL